jgi:hypothetical protein
MTYEYTLIYSRSSADTPFYTATENILDYIDAVWRTDGKYTTEESLTDDGLTKIIRVIFKDIDLWLEFIDDPIIKLSLAERNAYHLENNITVTRLEG